MQGYVDKERDEMNDLLQKGLAGEKPDKRGSKPAE
jgi:hypothetical protein